MVDGFNWLEGRPASKSVCGFSLLALFFSRKPLETCSWDLTDMKNGMSVRIHPEMVTNMRPLFHGERND